MRRKFITDGDEPEHGGRVNAQPAPSPFTVEGRTVSHEGDPVFCARCKSLGTTKCVPPFWPMTTTAKRRPNLDGDLCICKCAVPPRLMAKSGSIFAGHAFAGNQVAQQKGVAGWLERQGAPMGEHGFEHNQHFQIVDERTGEPLSGFRYELECDGELVTGITDAEGKTAVIYSKGADIVLVKLERVE